MPLARAATPRLMQPNERPFHTFTLIFSLAFLASMLRCCTPALPNKSGTWYTAACALHVPEYPVPRFAMLSHTQLALGSRDCMCCPLPHFWNVQIMASLRLVFCNFHRPSHVTTRDNEWLTVNHVFVMLNAASEESLAVMNSIRR